MNCHKPYDLVVGPDADVLPANANWGMSTLSVDHLRELTKGEGAKVGVVDTGCSDHPELNIAGRRDFTGSRSGALDVDGHGTHCTGTVGSTNANIGVGTGFAMYHGKGLGDSGQGSMSALLNAIEYCLSEGCRVVSNSWSGGLTVDAGTDRRLREWAERGAILVFAGGNAGPNTPQTGAPGNSPHVLNVAALNSNLTPASFSSAGSKIDTSGPGVNIWSLRQNSGYRQMSGTSMACPFVAGVIALYCHALQLANKPIPSVYDLRGFIASRSVDAHTPGVDRRTGPGWLSPVLLRATI